MAKPIGICTPEQYQIINARWQRISRFGFLPFVLLVGSTGFILFSAFSIWSTWLGLRAHHLKYSWSLEVTSGSLEFHAIMLVLAFMLPLMYWFGMKRHVLRYERQFGNPPGDQQS